MKKIESLTPEQIEKLDVYKKKYVDAFFESRDCDFKKVEHFVNFLYKLSGLEEPITILLNSPYECQIAGNIIKYSNQTDTHNLLKEIYYVIDNMCAATDYKIKECIQTSYHMSYNDNCWLAFYDFFNKELGLINNKYFDEFNEIINLNIFNSIQFKGFCIVSRNAKYKRRGNALHCETGAAVEFPPNKSGYSYKLFYWNGVCVPEKLIMTPDKITKNDILNENNVEIRRCYMERLGAEKYYNLLSDGNGIKLIDEDIDSQGNSMKLYETLYNDNIINKKVQFIEVICPSTNRKYNIYPPNQNCTNVWEAKASTFNNSALQYRHGDVGLKNIKKDFNKPILET